MRYQYRITKYNPALRDASGAFTGDDWTACSDVGRAFGGVVLTQAAYQLVEDAYLLAVDSLLRAAGVDSLQLRGLEIRSNSKLPGFVKPGADLNVAQCAEFARIALREQAWGRLFAPGRAYVHFGYDYYMYIGLPVKCTDALAAVQQRGLFVEPLRSPYLRANAVTAALHESLLNQLKR
jgi:hypothetical protein